MKFALAGSESNRTISIASPPSKDAVTTAVDSVAVFSGDDDGISNAVLKAMMTVDAGNVIGSGATMGTINWSFDSLGQAFNHLAKGESLVLDYTISATDTLASDTQNVRITTSPLPLTLTEGTAPGTPVLPHRSRS